jgi:hypothetical protein
LALQRDSSGITRIQGGGFGWSADDLIVSEAHDADRGERDTAAQRVGPHAGGGPAGPSAPRGETQPVAFDVHETRVTSARVASMLRALGRVSERHPGISLDTVLLDARGTGGHEPRRIDVHGVASDPHAIEQWVSSLRTDPALSTLAVDTLERSGLRVRFRLQEALGAVAYEVASDVAHSSDRNGRSGGDQRRRELAARVAAACDRAGLDLDRLVVTHAMGPRAAHDMHVSIDARGHFAALPDWVDALSGEAGPFELARLRIALAPRRPMSHALTGQTGILAVTAELLAVEEGVQAGAQISPREVHAGPSAEMRDPFRAVLDTRRTAGRIDGLDRRVTLMIAAHEIAGREPPQRSDPMLSSARHASRRGAIRRQLRP